MIDAHHQISLCYMALGRLDQAEEAQREAVTRCERLVVTRPDDSDDRRGLANASRNLAAICQESGRAAESVVLWHKYVIILEGLAEEHPQDADTRYELAKGLFSLGQACSQTDGGTDEAAEAFRRAMPHYEALTEEHPREAFRNLGKLAISHNDLATILTRYVRYAEAAEAFRRSAEHYETIVATQPENLGARHNLSVILFNLGTMYHMGNHRAEAEKPYRAANVLLEKLVADRPDIPLYRFSLAKNAINLGILLIETRRQSEALPMLQMGEKILEKLIHDHPKLIDYRRALSEALGPLGRLYRESVNPTEARRAYQRAREILEALPHLSADELYNLAGILAQCARFSDARGLQRAGDETNEEPASLDVAMDTLRRAIAGGFQDPDRLRLDTNLDPLRARVDFQTLTMDLAFPTDPISR